MSVWREAFMKIVADVPGEIRRKWKLLVLYAITGVYVQRVCSVLVFERSDWLVVIPLYLVIFWLLLNIIPTTSRHYQFWLFMSIGNLTLLLRALIWWKPSPWYDLLPLFVYLVSPILYWPPSVW